MRKRKSWSSTGNRSWNRRGLNPPSTQSVTGEVSGHGESTSPPPHPPKKDVTLGEEEEKWWKIRISKPNSDPPRISSNPCHPFPEEGNLKEKSEKSVSTSEPKEICFLNCTWKSFTPSLSYPFVQDSCSWSIGREIPPNFSLEIDVTAAH